MAAALYRPILRAPRLRTIRRRNEKRAGTARAAPTPYVTSAVTSDQRVQDSDRAFSVPVTSSRMIGQARAEALKSNMPSIEPA